MATRIIDVVDAVPTGPRRRCSEHDKARIVSEAMMPGTSVAEVARRYGVCGSLIYRWRRTLPGSSVA
ncbi:transposase [Novosphingobium sp. Gsoil 351]|uniref:transposase n=1 Tax=Novosphingobium sp. Gsoil 351 TaxID=2675225 RepID=UPI0012B44453|nr:transposase [Novosphingobium sp. Gsoil 351]QGN54052.1 transposase [Novosphingobium sp. Gsoil 351]